MGEVPERSSARQPTTWRYVGVAAAAALAASSWGSGSGPVLHTRILWPGLSPSAETGGSPLAATISIAAMAVLLLAWWQLRTARLTERWWWVTAALWFAPLLASVPLYSRDLYSYAAQGALWAEGLSPYEHGVRDLASDWRESTAPTWLDTPAPYGPVWLLIARGAASLAGDRLWLALLLLRLVAVVGVVVMAWAVSDVAHRVGSSRRSAAWLAVAAPLVGAHYVSGAHNDAVMVAAVVAGFALALRRLLVPAVVVVALGAMVKVTAVVALPFIALIWARHLTAVRLSSDDASDLAEAWRVPLRPREVLSGLALTGVTAAIPMALVSRASGLGFAWLNPGATPGRNEQWTSLPTGLGMAIGAVGHVLGRPEWRDSAISVARVIGLVLLAVILVLVWLAVAKPAGDGAPLEAAGAEVVAAERARVVRAAGWALLAVIVLAPVFLGWYFLWALPLFAATLGTGSLAHGLERWLPVAVTVLCFAQLPDGYSLGLTTTAIGVPIAVATAVVLALRGLRWSRRVEWSGILDLSRPLTAGPMRNDGRVRQRPSPSDPGSGFPGAGAGWATTATDVPRRRTRRGWLLVALPVLALLAFAVWAVTARIAEDDVTAHGDMMSRIDDVERQFPPLGSSSRPPCGITDEGWAELTWGALTGPSVDDIETWLRAFGWQRGVPEGATAVLYTFEDGRELTARVSPPNGDIGVRLTATSAANSLACLLH